MKATKDRIWESAIGLFAEQGYDRTSMRDIAEKVGIRASSLYNHFPSKEAILDAILEFYRENMNRVRIPDGDIDKITEMFPAWGIFLEGWRRVVKQFSDPRMGGIVRILVSEMHRNLKVREFAERWFYDENREAATRLFQALSRNGKLAPGDPAAAAKVYIAVVNANVQEIMLRGLASTDFKEQEKKVQSQLQFLIAEIPPS